MTAPRVVVSVAFWRCHAFVREAVESILAQTMRDLVLVVVNDGDPVPPWDALADIDDPRLVRFDLPENRGCYFAHEVVRRASPAPFFAVQDADDASAPHRLERLLDAIGDLPGASSMLGGRYNGKSHDRAHREVGPQFRHRRGHTGLWRASVLRAIGGYYGGYRVGWDSLIVNAMSLLGEQHAAPGTEPLAFVDEVLYTIRHRDDSLTHAPDTRKGSPERNRLAALYKSKWKRMWLERGTPALPQAIRREMIADVSLDHAVELEREAMRLARLLRPAPTRIPGAGVQVHR